MDRVSFTRMKDGTKEDYEFLNRHEIDHTKHTAKRLLTALVELDQSLSGYQITLTAVDEVEGPNYVSTMASMDVARNGRHVATMHPEKRVYPVQAMPTTEAAIDNGIFRDIYLVIGDAQADGGWAVRSYIKPFANWIWAGAILMALGGVVSLSDRRYRVAAGARRSQARAVPAE